MKESLDIDKLKEDVLCIYEKYLENPDDMGNKLKAKEVYDYCWSVSFVDLKKDLASAVLGLFEIGYDNPHLKKPSKDLVKRYIKTLKKE